MPALCQAVCSLLGTEFNNTAIAFKELIVLRAEGGIMAEKEANHGHPGEAT